MDKDSSWVEDNKCPLVFLEHHVWLSVSTARLHSSTHSCSITVLRNHVAILPSGAALRFTSIWTSRVRQNTCQSRLLKWRLVSIKLYEAYLQARYATASTIHSMACVSELWFSCTSGKYAQMFGVGLRYCRRDVHKRIRNKSLWHASKAEQIKARYSVGCITIFKNWQSEGWGHDARGTTESGQKAPAVRHWHHRDISLKWTGSGPILHYRIALYLTVSLYVSLLRLAHGLSPLPVEIGLWLIKGNAKSSGAMCCLVGVFFACIWYLRSLDLMSMASKRE